MAELDAGREGGGSGNLKNVSLRVRVAFMRLF
jgi:hypothetical protein